MVIFASCNGTTESFVLPSHFCSHVSPGDSPQLFMQIRRKDRGTARQGGISSSPVKKSEVLAAAAAAAFVSAFHSQRCNYSTFNQAQPVRDNYSDKATMHSAPHCTH